METARGDLVLAIDQGTSATKACVFAPPDRLLGAASIPVTRSYPEPGAVEQDPRELLESCRTAARQALRMARVGATDLAGAALSNQGESFLLFGSDGEPLTSVIGWQDNRCGDVLGRVAASVGAQVTVRTGLPLHAEFTAPKLAHRLATDDLPADVRFGTLDTWLIHQLDPSRPHITDRATAQRTMLCELDGSSWSAELCDWFGVPAEVLPAIRPCDAPDAALMLDECEVPLLACGYDTGLALLGHGCLDAGQAKASFGTCLGVMIATGPRPVHAAGLVRTIAFTRAQRSRFALDGEIAGSGSLVSWMQRLGIVSSLLELDRLAASVPDTAGAVIVPALTGLGAPHWRDDVTGRVVGVTEAFGRGQFARATIDAIAFSLRDVLDAVREAGIPITTVGVDGGLTRSAAIMQRSADVCQTTLVHAMQPQAAAYGAAVLGMIGSKLLTEDELRRVTRGDRYVEPGDPPSDGELERWERAVEMALDAQDRRPRQGGALPAGPLTDVHRTREP